MTTPTLSDIKRFEQLRLLPAKQQETLLAELPLDQQQTVRELLDSNQDVAERLKISGSSAGNAIPGTQLTVSAGDRIGDYRVVRELGKGGMGIVYLVDQLAPIQRQVALKVIKPNVASDDILRRFETERQSLARMNHPNVAAIYDAGLTDSGLPFFTMEYLDGQRITAFCRQNKLSLKHRLRLIVMACRGIEHAHQRAVIHRDIKPSNVMVIEEDRELNVKVIDFGLAKATQQELTQRSLGTKYGDLVGTLEYMSPEQSVAETLDLDTRTDVFSMGVLIFELLTGTTPIPRSTMQEGSLLMKLLRIQRFEPERPSVRAAAARAADEPACEFTAKQLHGDLDWIVIKALENDRERRYSSVADLRADIERFLDDEPVSARAYSTAYRLKKFAVRNRSLLSFVTAAILIVSLLLFVRAKETQVQSQQVQIALNHFLHSDNIDQQTALPIFERHRHHVVPLLKTAADARTTQRKVELAALERLRAMIGLKLLGVSNPDLVSEFSTTSDPGIVREILMFAEDAAPEQQAQWSDSFQAAMERHDYEAASVLAVVALHSGNSDLFQSISTRCDTPAVLHRLIAAYDVWHRDVSVMINMIESAEEEQTQWAALLCVGFRKQYTYLEKAQLGKCLEDLLNRDQSMNTVGPAKWLLGRARSAVLWIAYQHGIEQLAAQMKAFPDRSVTSARNDVPVNSLGTFLIDIDYSPTPQERPLYPQYKDSSMVRLSVAATEISIDQYIEFAKFANENFDDNIGTEFEISVKWTGANMDWALDSTHPCQEISFFEALAFCNWLSQRENLELAYSRKGNTWTWNRAANGYRLPTESEWMFLACADPNNGYCWGSDDQMATTYAVFAAITTATTGSRMPNRLGLQDFHGNVWEWTWSQGPASPATNPELANLLEKIKMPGNGVVFHGGTASHELKLCDARDRRIGLGKNRASQIGVRIVRTLPP